jgi:glycosyltransferase involved in cell wall biosynthesis
VGINIVVDGVIFEMQKRGGIATIFSEIIPRMCMQDLNVMFQLFTSGQKFQDLPQHPQIHAIEFPEITKDIRPRRVFRPLTLLVHDNLIKHRFSRLKSPIWHSTYYTYLPQWHGPSVVTVHDMIYEKFPEIFNQYGEKIFIKQKRECVLNADVIICDSVSTMLDVKAIMAINTDRCSVIPLACKDIFRVKDSSDTELTLISNLPFLLFVGRRVHYKNFRALLVAYSKWKFRDEVFLIVASHESFTKEELDWLAELKIEERVRIVLDANDAQLCELYNRAAALVFPSLYEGFGIPLLEAMNCGCPIVASNIPSTLEVAGDVPIYFKPSNESQLITALDQVVVEGKNSARVFRGFDLAQKYSWDIAARKTLDVYRSLI